MTLHQTHRRAEQGFTLVELAIVMVIIGILIGGILKGQELIANARISSTTSQVKALDAAINTFQDKYNALPGDIANVQNRLPNCTNAPCNTGGNGNGQIGDGTIEGFPVEASEQGRMFVHLNAADLVSGINPNGGRTFGGVFPTVPAGGGMWAGYSAAAPNGTTLVGGRHYANLSGTGGTGATNGLLNATAAAQIDRKLDDGLPQTGTVQTTGNNCVTGTGATASYNEAGGAGTCSLIARLLN